MKDSNACSGVKRVEQAFRPAMSAGNRPALAAEVHSLFVDTSCLEAHVIRIVWSKCAVLLILSVLILSHKAFPQTSQPPYLDPNQPLETRLDDLIRRMTLQEKASQMQDVAPAIERLHIPAYNWWNEGLHGVARAGYATVFPQAIGLAATRSEERR